MGPAGDYLQIELICTLFESKPEEVEFCTGWILDAFIAVVKYVSCSFQQRFLLSGQLTAWLFVKEGIALDYLKLDVVWPMLSMDVLVE